MCPWDLLSRIFLSDPFLSIQTCLWRCLSKSGYWMTWRCQIQEWGTIGNCLSLYHMYWSASLLSADIIASKSHWACWNLLPGSYVAHFKSLFCCWDCACNPAFSNCSLVGLDLSDFIRLLHPIWGHTHVFIFYGPPLSGPCKSVPGCITPLAVLMSRNKNSVGRNFNTSKDTLGFDEEINKLL